MSKRIDFHNRAVTTFMTMTALGALVGCGGAEGAADQLPTYDVTARVTVDGKPVEGATLTMTPTDPEIPSSGAQLAEGGTGKFSTYAPEGGIPVGEYMAGLMMSSMEMKPVPVVNPVKVTITEEMDGGEVPIEFQGTGKMQKSMLPPP